MRGVRLTRLLVSLAAALPPGVAPAASFRTIYTAPPPATGPDGSRPLGGLTRVGGFLYGVTQEGGAAGRGTIFRFNPANDALTTIYDFAGGTDGDYPGPALVRGGGMLYGITQFSGPFFQLDPISGKKTNLYVFGYDGPRSTPVFYSGKFYGTMPGGCYPGTKLGGTAFVFDPATSALTVLHTFTGARRDGACSTEPLTVDSAMIYGTTTYGGLAGVGTLFAINPATGKLRTLQSFDPSVSGYAPKGALTSFGGKLFGTASDGGGRDAGTVFSYSPASHSFDVVYTFTGGADGGNPVWGVTQSGGMLYVQTTTGGASGKGAIVRIDPVTGAATVLPGAQDAPGASPLLASNGALLGVSYVGGAAGTGTIFAIDPATGNQKTLHDFLGANSAFKGSFADSGSALSTDGTSLFLSLYAGGPAGQGAIVKLDPATGHATDLTQFNALHGTHPTGPLIFARGLLYGTASTGGPGGQGTLFSLNRSTGVLDVQHAFAGGTDGANPYGGLARAPTGLLYGTTARGGSARLGTLFQFDPAQGATQVLSSFAGGRAGQYPTTRPVAVGHSLYGVTGSATGSVSSPSSGGTLYRFDTVSQTQSVAYTFDFQGNAANGFTPLAEPILAGGRLYGTTFNGGIIPIDTFYGGGVAYSYAPASKTYATVFAFDGPFDGTSGPEGALVSLNGLLYGTTVGGGTARAGTVFSLDPVSRTRTVLANFTDPADGCHPTTLLRLRGTLYGTTGYCGSARQITVYQLQP